METCQGYKRSPHEVRKTVKNHPRLGRLCIDCNRIRLNENKPAKNRYQGIKKRRRSDKGATSAFYRQMFDLSTKRCEECGKFLRDYRPHYVSHRHSRGSHPELKFKPSNINILCFEHHQQWEFGDRKKMRIFRNFK